MSGLTVTCDEVRAVEDDVAVCAFCSRDAKLWLHVPRDWRRPNDDGRYTVYWCDGCECGMLQPRPTAAEVARFYEIDAYYTHNHNGGSPKVDDGGFTNRLLRRIAWRFDGGCSLSPAWVRGTIGGPLRICDLGCGNGALLRQFIDDGHEGVGVEPDAQAREHAEGMGLRVLAGTAEHLPEQLPRGAFDLVILRHVLEHCIDPAAALQGASALLADAGRLTVEVPNNAAAGLGRSGPCWYWLDVPRHLNFFNKCGLVRLCEAAGLSVTRVEYVGYSRQFSRKWIETEQRIHDCFAGRKMRPSPRRNGLWQAWRLLAATAFTSAERKYDSVRVTAVRDRGA